MPVTGPNALQAYTPEGATDPNAALADQLRQSLGAQADPLLAQFRAHLEGAPDPLSLADQGENLARTLGGTFDPMTGEKL